MAKYFYTTTNGTEIGRASYFHETRKNADTKCRTQNDKADTMSIKTRYEVCEFNGEPDMKDCRS